MEEVIKAPDSYFTGATGESLTKLMIQRNLCDIFLLLKSDCRNYTKILNELKI